MQKRKPLIAGNWKMNGLSASLGEVAALRAGLAELGAGDRIDVLICPPATLIAPMAQALAGSVIAVGGQDCHAKASGAFTGDISAAMLADSGARYVILGHSERRSLHGERDCDVKAKAVAAITVGLHPIICVGETAGERLMGLTIEVVGRQLAGSLPALGSTPLVIAYEPVWAIGTGLTPSNADIEEVHTAIRTKIATMFGEDASQSALILYGGSVKPENALEILALPDVDGALVGGASLLAKDFLGIIAAQLKNLA